MTKRDELLKLVTVKTEDMKLDCLQNTALKDMTFKVKEMTIAENKEYRKLIADKKDDDLTEAMKFACGKVMIDPLFFTDDEFESMNGIGEAIINEIFFKIPTIGLDEEQKEEYRKKVIEFAKNQMENESKSEVEVKKPKGKRGSSSSN